MMILFQYYSKLISNIIFLCFIGVIFIPSKVLAVESNLTVGLVNGFYTYQDKPNSDFLDIYSSLKFGYEFNRWGVIGNISRSYEDESHRYFGVDLRYNYKLNNSFYLHPSLGVDEINDGLISSLGLTLSYEYYDDVAFFIENKFRENSDAGNYFVGLGFSLKFPLDTQNWKDAKTSIEPQLIDDRDVNESLAYLRKDIMKSAKDINDNLASSSFTGNVSFFYISNDYPIKWDKLRIIVDGELWNEIKVNNNIAAISSKFPKGHHYVEFELIGANESDKYIIKGNKHFRIDDSRALLIRLNKATTILGDYIDVQFL